MKQLTPSTFLIILIVLSLLTTETYAFGAGEIPAFAYLHDKAFRHGDIENILEELAKTVGNAAGGVSLAGFAQALLGSMSGGGGKFTHADVKRVYFGNWLRDYSQAMDIAGLSKLSGDTIVLIVSILGFVTFGFATEEYQVTSERLGVYLPVEHIDNPKGYAEAEGDARQYDRRLRPPVHPEELEIDPRTGMKNYMASENRGWDTSTAHIRRVFRACIDRGRRAQGREGPELWEAYRLLGTGLHTMEDLLAHSNWCELALRKMGYEQVFCHVGENVIIDTPNGPAPPLITGTFGGADFLHSLMGEATDHLSQASVVDLSKNLDNAAQSDTDSSLIRNILQKLPIGGSNDEDKVDQADAMKEKAKAYNFNPDDVLPPEAQQQMLQLLRWRDDIFRDILAKIEMIPGLEGLINAFSDALNAFVYTILAPYVAPILKQVTEVLTDGSKALLDSHADQYEVFDNPDASDPSHSLLSKDHFALILNEPAGKTALVVVKYAVGLIVNAWFEQGQHPDHVIDQILEAFHHPYFNVGRSRIQQEMFQEMENWFRSLDSEEVEQTLQALTKESVRNGQNKRQGSDDDMTSSTQVYGQSQVQSQQEGYNPSLDRSRYHADESYSEAVTEGRPASSYGDRGGYGTQSYSAAYGQGQKEQERYSHPSHTNAFDDGRVQQTYGGARYSQETVEHDSYGSTRSHRPPYEDEQPAYSRRHKDEDSYEPRASGYGQREEDAPNRYEQSVYEQQDRSYGEERPTQSRQHHSEHRHHNNPEGLSSGGYNPSYVATTETSSRYGGDEYGVQPSREDQTAYGSSSERSGYAPSYGRAGGESVGYGESYERGNEHTYRGHEHGRRQEGYGGEQPVDEGQDSESRGYGRGGYGQSEYGQSQEDSYGRRRGDEEEREGHHGRRHHSQQFAEYEGGRDEGAANSGYSRGGYESEGRVYGEGEDETFGAERLRIDDNDQERPHHSHHQKHHRQDW
ncbi:Het-C-domain-containing protein [Trametopsis cervina]|nr:Het-C-domain-containing protein [Trametopsis cervina]